ncbi:MAG TPA: hypothetical protein GXX46_04630 [Peptococcaceae bacterium]|nr:hypothetical protein [Peptococcaceae bacterium]
MLRNFQRIILAATALSILLEPIAPFSLNEVISLLGIVLFLVALPTIKPKNRILPLVIVTVGLVIMWLTSQPFGVLLNGAGSMLNIVSILIVMQLFSIPIQLGTYTQDIEFLLFKYIKKEQGLYFFTTIISHFFATFLLFGTIPVMLSLLGEPLKNNVRNFERFAATAMARGYAMMISWAPGAVMFLLVTGITKLEWSQIFLPGFLLSIIGIATSVLLEGRLTLSKERIISAEQDRRNINEKEAWKSVLEIVTVILSMIVLIFSLEKTKIFPSTYCVMLAGLFIFGIWMIKFRRSPDLKAVIRKYWREGLLRAVDLAIMFVAIGILTKVVEKSDLITAFYNSIGISRWGDFVIAIIPLVTVFLAYFGLHPMITVTIVGSIFMSFQNIIPPTAIALALLLGSIVSFIVTPLNGINITLSNYLNRPASQITLQWNGLFSLIFLVEGIALIYLWTSLGI